MEDKPHQVIRKKNNSEQQRDEKYEQELAEKAQEFKDDQLRSVLRKCYKTVKKYGPDVVLKSMEDSALLSFAPLSAGIVNDDAFVKMEDEISGAYFEEATEVTAQSIYSRSHDHEETSKRNALFLIESSEKLESYDRDLLVKMRAAYNRGDYDDVADLAYLHDCNRRPVVQPPEQEVGEDTVLREMPLSPWSRVAELLDEAVEEENEESAIQLCVDAMRHLSRDLTYENRAAAKESIQRAIKHIRE